jgi:hypothetical protein
MTYDTAVWKPANEPLNAAAEFEQRSEDSDARYPDFRPPIPELVQLADLLEAEFTGPSPWEDLRDSMDGDFLYLTMNYSEGPEVEAFIARHAKRLGLVVYSPLSEDIVESNG